VVLHVLVGGDAVVVEKVEDGGHAHGHLDEGGQSAVLGKTVLVVPAPVSSDNEWNIESFGRLTNEIFYLDIALP